MTILWFLFNSSSVFPHRTYEAYLKDPRSRPHRCTKLWKLIPDDLPNYEETERCDVTEGHRQSVGGPWFLIRLVLRSILT